MQLSNFISDKGLLVTNDLNTSRIKALIRNVERFGLRNVVILNESPENIAKVLPHVFDAVLIDAPCSGEGMFNKDPKAKKAYEKFGPETCSAMQYEIMKTMPDLVREGAKLIYSTCTFAKEENEHQMERFLKENEAFKPAEIISDDLEVNGHMARIWPHKHRGEGHFMCRLDYFGSAQTEIQPLQSGKIKPLECFEVFKEKHLKSQKLEGIVEVMNDKVYLMPETRYNLKGLKVVREGLLLGEIKKDKFVPFQTMAMAIKAEDFHPVLHFSSDSLEIKKYLKGETLQVDTPDNGYHLICVDAYPLGFAKIDHGVFKNLYPASWRML